MTESLDRHFGLIIAFVLPGFTCLWGISAFDPTIASWLAHGSSKDPTIGGFLYSFLASLAAGLTVSGIRWAAIDTLFHKTGINKPHLDFKKLNQNLMAYQLAVEHNYRYFQFYSNMIVAILVFTICRQWAFGFWGILPNLGCLALILILVTASRDCLVRFYERVSLVLGTRRD